MGIYFGKRINFDEYDPEIEQLPLFSHKNMSSKEFSEKIRSLFQRMFFKDLYGKKDKLRKVARETYDLLKADKK